MQRRKLNGIRNPFVKTEWILPKEVVTQVAAYTTYISGNVYIAIAL